MSLIDIGANLAHESFAADLDAVLERAWAAGVERILVTGSCAQSNQDALALARRYPGRLFSTAGLHPHHAAEWSDTLSEQIRSLAQAPEVVALGECGLDYNRNYASHADQRRAFEAQLALAVDLKKPLFLHQRDAHVDFLPLLEKYRAQLGAVVVHCFTDTREAMHAYLALDCYIGITGWVADERRGRDLYTAAADIPDDRLLIETDAPYLRPRNAPKSKERRNEPDLLPYVVQALAAARQQSEAHIAAITTDNARRCFGLP